MNHSQLKREQIIDAVVSGEFREWNDARLQDALGVCVDKIQGVNQIAAEKTIIVARLIRDELAGRTEENRHRQTQRIALIAAVLSALSVILGVLGIVIQSLENTRSSSYPYL